MDVGQQAKKASDEVRARVAGGWLIDGPVLGVCRVLPVSFEIRCGRERERECVGVYSFA